MTCGRRSSTAAYPHQPLRLVRRHSTFCGNEARDGRHVVVLGRQVIEQVGGGASSERQHRIAVVTLGAASGARYFEVLPHQRLALLIAIHRPAHRIPLSIATPKRPRKPLCNERNRT